MNLPQLSVTRKIAMLCFITLFVIFGINSYRKITITAIPSMDIPYVSITTVYPGASPEEIEVDVAKKIEDAVAMIEGLKNQTSLCMENACVNTLEFYSGIDASAKVHEVREKLNIIQDDLPSGIETPKIEEISINAVPIVSFFLTGKQSLDELYDYVDDKLVPRFSTITGVGSVKIHGGNKLELHIELNREKLAAANITVGEVINRLSVSNLKLPAGQIGELGKEVAVAFDAEFKDIEEIKNIDISSMPGKSVYFGDIADIRLESKKMREMAFYKGIPAIQFEIVKKDEANTVKIIDSARKIYNEIVKEELPGGMELHWFFDDKEYIQASVNDSWTSVFAGIILTALILFMFLHNPNSTFIIAVTMPVTIIISIGGIYVSGCSFDMMTLVALGCASGVLVTNSIVVVENILNRIFKGDDVKTAAITGTNQVLIAVVASALTNVVVFLPVTQMKSIIGMFVKPFAITMVFVTLASLFISFTLTAILSSALFKKNNEVTNPVIKCFSNIWNYVYGKFDTICQKSFNLVRKVPLLTSIILLSICVVLSIYYIPKIQLEFMPQCDQNKLSIFIEYPSNISLDGTCEKVKEIIDIIEGHKEVRATGVTVGYANGIAGKVNQGVNIVEIIVHLIDKNKRITMIEFANVLRKDFEKLKDVMINVNIPMPTGQSGAEISAYISGSDSKIIRKYILESTNTLRKKGLIAEADNTIRNLKPRISFIPNRAILKNIGINELMLGTTVVGLIDGIKIGRFKKGNRSFDIRLKTNEIKNIEDAENTVMGNYKQESINLDVLAKSKSDPVSMVISRNNRKRSEYMYFNTTNNASTGDIMNVLRKEIATKLPTGYSLHFGTPLDTMEETMNEFAEVFLSAIFLLYLLMASIMESWSRPFLILFTLPLGFIGMFAASITANVPISMVSLLGGVMMIGVVVNNAILIMDEVTELTKNGILPHDAMSEALKNKLRPIIMTSIASIAGMIPMAVGKSMGSEMRASVGVGVVGGLLLSSILTVYLIPALYFSFTKNKAKSE